MDNKKPLHFICNKKPKVTEILMFYQITICVLTTDR